MGIWSDIAVWRGPSPNQGNNIDDHMYVVLHIAQGSYDGTIAWQMNPDANVSSHFTVAKDGRCTQLVDTNREAWTQAQGNPYSISIEFEGFVPTALTPQQLEMAAKILAKAHTHHGVPLQVTNRVGTRGLGHHSMGAESGVNWGHTECPGINIKNQKPAIVQRATQIVTGSGGTFVMLSPDEEKDLALLAYRMLSGDANPRADDRWNKNMPSPIVGAIKHTDSIVTSGGVTQDMLNEAVLAALTSVDFSAQVVNALQSAEGKAAIVAAVNEAEDS